MRKFKIGDKVKVISKSCGDSLEETAQHPDKCIAVKKGDILTIFELSPFDENKYSCGRYVANWFFAEHDLQLVNKIKFKLI